MKPETYPDAMGISANFLVPRSNPFLIASCNVTMRDADDVFPYRSMFVIVRSGSKLGSRYKGLSASSNLPYCPSVRGVVATALPETANSVLEIVIDGLTEAAIARATATGIRAACVGSGGEILRISAGNYGGKLGAFHYHLRKLLV